MPTLSLGEIRGLSDRRLAQRRPEVVKSLKRHLEIFRATDPAVELITEWGNKRKGIRHEVAYELQEKLAEETERPLCNTCHWVANPGQTDCCYDPSLDIIEPLDDYPDDATIEDWDQAFGSLAGENPDDDLLEIDSGTYVITRV